MVVAMLRWHHICLALIAGVGSLPVAAVDKDDAGTIELARMDKHIKATDRNHWAYQPIRKPELPTVKEVGWVRNPIDAFILAPLEAKGWKPAPAASGRVLLRRVHLGLTGLPPTLEEQDAFPGTPAALDAVVGELLRRPTYG